LQALDLPGEMVAIVHDDHVFSFRLSRREETRQERHEEQIAIRAGIRKNSDNHFVTPAIN